MASLLVGWFASAWHYKRKVQALRRQLGAVRQTASEHANQARRQIGQLQAELAARPPRPPAPAPAPSRSARRPAAALPPDVGIDGHDNDEALPAEGFANTAILPNGFSPTTILPNGFANTRVTRFVPDTA